VIASKIRKFINTQIIYSIWICTKQQAEMSVRRNIHRRSKRKKVWTTNVNKLRNFSRICRGNAMEVEACDQRSDFDV
jgi:hypothetical protein